MAATQTHNLEDLHVGLSTCDRPNNIG